MGGKKKCAPTIERVIEKGDYRIGKKDTEPNA